MRTFIKRRSPSGKINFSFILLYVFFILLSSLTFSQAGSRYFGNAGAQQKLAAEAGQSSHRKLSSSAGSTESAGKPAAGSQRLKAQTGSGNNTVIKTVGKTAVAGKGYVKSGSKSCSNERSSGDGAIDANKINGAQTGKKGADPAAAIEAGTGSDGKAAAVSASVVKTTAVGSKAAVSVNTAKNSGAAPGKAVSPVKSVVKPVTKTAYLTFDDGPTPAVTPKILEILKKYEIKATFFVLGQLAKGNPALIKREKEDGHFICGHTFSHRYSSIYSSTNAFLNELKKTDGILSSILGEGYTSRLVRFPGGSFGERLRPFREAARKAGYSYIDWNALNGDSEALKVPADKLYKNIVETTAGKNEIVILMHDSPGKDTTIEALPGILDYLKKQGYNFETLENYRSLQLSAMNR